MLAKRRLNGITRTGRCVRRYGETDLSSELGHVASLMECLELDSATDRLEYVYKTGSTKVRSPLLPRRALQHQGLSIGACGRRFTRRNRFESARCAPVWLVSTSDVSTDTTRAFSATSSSIAPGFTYARTRQKSAQQRAGSARGEATFFFTPAGSASGSASIAFSL